MSESFFEELKRRKVIRIATSYVVVAWILLQVADVVAEPLGLPSWFQPTLIVGLVILFPIAIILAWLYEVTAKGIVRDPTDLRVEVTDALPATIGSDEKEDRIAVLPLVDLSEEESSEILFLCDGISDEIINTIAPHKELRVIARTSSFRFRGKELDIGNIRDELDVTHVITGSIRRSGDHNRISVQLIDTQDASQIWAESIQRNLEQPFELQTEVAHIVDDALIETLDLKALKEPRAWHLAPAAHDHYQVARDAFWRADFPTVLENAEASMKIDPNNPLVPTLFAQVYLYWPRYGFTVTRDELRKARQNVSRALSIDAEYPGAHAVRGMLSLFLERDFKTAFEVTAGVAIKQPGAAEWVPQLLVYANRYEEAVEIHRRIAQRDPLNPFNLLVWANRLNWLGRHEIAMNVCERARDIDPGHLILKNNEFRWALRDGDIDKARALMAEWGIDPDHPADEPSVPWLPRSISLWQGSRLYGEMGDYDRAYELAKEIEKEAGFTPTTVAEAYINAGAIDDAYRIWDIGINQYDLGVYDLAQPPDMREADNKLWLDFRDDERYEDYLERLGLDESSLSGIDWSVSDRVLK